MTNLMNVDGSEREKRGNVEGVPQALPRAEDLPSEQCTVLEISLHFIHKRIHKNENCKTLKTILQKGLCSSVHSKLLQ